MTLLTGEKWFKRLNKQYKPTSSDPDILSNGSLALLDVFPLIHLSWALSTPQVYEHNKQYWKIHIPSSIHSSRKSSEQGNWYDKKYNLVYKLLISYLFVFLDFLFSRKDLEVSLSDNKEPTLSPLARPLARPLSVSSGLSRPASSSVSLSVWSWLLHSRLCSSLPPDLLLAKVRAFLTVLREMFLQQLSWGEDNLV